MMPEPLAWYYAACVIPRCRRGELDFLVMETEKLEGPDKGLRLWQFPGGMEELVDNGNPLKTLTREVYEETGLILKPNHRENPEFICQQNFDGHLRYFHLAWRHLFTGILRTEVKNDRSKILYVPQWKNYEFLKRNLCGSQALLLTRLKLVRDEWLRHRRAA